MFKPVWFNTGILVWATGTAIAGMPSAELTLFSGRDMGLVMKSIPDHLVMIHCPVFPAMAEMCSCCYSLLGVQVLFKKFWSAILWAVTAMKKLELEIAVKEIIMSLIIAFLLTDVGWPLVIKTSCHLSPKLLFLNFE